MAGDVAISLFAIFVAVAAVVASGNLTLKSFGAFLVACALGLAIGWAMLSHTNTKHQAERANWHTARGF